MALHEFGTYANEKDFVLKLKTFLEQAGWDIDLYANDRLHFHLGLYHFEVAYKQATICSVAACTGYDAGQPIASQPGGVSGKRYLSGQRFGIRFFSTATAIYIAKYNGAYTTYNYVGLGWIADKIGAWNGGQFFVGGWGDTKTFFRNTTVDTSIYYEGAWYNSVSSGGLSGSYVVDGAGALSGKMPFYFNAGVLPTPIIVFRKNPANTSQYIPLGYAPGVAVGYGSDTYTIGETITIGADTWVWAPGDSGASPTMAELLFKLG